MSNLTLEVSRCLRCVKRAERLKITLLLAILLAVAGLCAFIA